MITDEHEFLIEEYKQAISSGHWLEESIARVFKNLSILFIWQMALIGFLLKDSISLNENILDALLFCPSAYIIIVTSFFVLIASIISIINMYQAREGDVRLTSRINFLREYFLRNPPNGFDKEEYLKGAPRLVEINPIEINKREAWKLHSDFALYSILCSVIGAISLLIIIHAFIGQFCYLFDLLTIFSFIAITILISKSKLKKKLG